jgi:hypothetical protein
LDSLVQLELTLALEPCPQRAALHKWKHEVKAVSHGTRIEDGQDARVREPSGQANLAREPFRLRRPDKVGPHHLDGDGPTVGEVLRQVDRRSRATPDNTFDRVSAGDW